MKLLDPKQLTRNGGEIRLKARPMSRGVAIGRVVCLYGSNRQFFRIKIDESAIESEIRRARAAFRLARRQLNRLGPQSTAGSTHGILGAQRAMIEDSSLLSKIETAIREQKINAEWAVKVVTDGYISQYKAIPDEHLRQRYIDIEDIAERVLNALGGGETPATLGKDSIIVAKELMPSTLAEQSAGRPAAVITEHGGWTSHTFILARELNLPAVTGIRKILRRAETGDWVIVDGYNGTVILHPDAKTLERYRVPAARFQQINYNDVTVENSHASTLDGRSITLRVNVDLPEVYKRARRIGARGIGLYRSEFLFNRFKGYPTESEQVTAYREIAEFAGEDGVKIRTFDLGPDLAYGTTHNREKNPALGLRAIRLSLADSRNFKTQIRAILRAAYGNSIDILIPMVSGASELRSVREIIDGERAVLTAKRIEHGEPKLGAMIEVPSAVMMIDSIAAEADYLCLGTNDLVQYMLAVDRDNENVAGWFRSLHPAVIRSIQRVIEAADAVKKPLEVCGEMAGSPFYIPLLIGLGANELSMNVNSILRVRKVISGVAFEETIDLVRDVEGCQTAEQVEGVLEEHIRAKWSHLIQPERMTKPRI